MQEYLKLFLEKLTWQITALIVGGSAAYFWFNVDRSQLELNKTEVTTTQATIRTLTRKLQEIQKFEAELEIRRKKFAQLVNKLNQAQAKLPLEINIPILLEEIFTEARNVGLEIDGIAPDRNEENRNIYSAQGIRIDAIGSYVQFLIFFDRLSRLKQLVGIEAAEISRNGEKLIPLSGVLTGIDDGILKGDRVYHSLNLKFNLVAYRLNDLQAKKNDKSKKK